MKKVLKIVGVIVGVLVLIVAAYVIYLLVTYHRIEDNQALEVAQPVKESAGMESELEVGKEYTAVTYNIGFGAYTPDYSFLWTEESLPGRRAGRACWKP